MCKKYGLPVNKYVFSLIFLFTIAFTTTSYSYEANDFNWTPPFLVKDEKPSIIIIYDNSGSMREAAYTTGSTSTFNSQKEYYGYFEPTTYYTYSGDTTSSGVDSYFYADNSTGTWNGNWLNWATMKRADVARKVMGGGNYNSINNCYEGVSQDNSKRVSDFEYNGIQRTDLNGHLKYMTPVINLKRTIVQPEKSMYFTYNGKYYRIRVKDSKKEGVLHKFKDKARMALFVYDTSPTSYDWYGDPAYHHGGKYLHYMSEDESTLNALINDINQINPTTWTPLAETLFTVYGYIQQSNSTGGAISATNTGPKYRGNSSYVSSLTNDPYFFPTYGEKIECTQQNVILITDGESTKDENIPSTFNGQKIANRINPKPNSYSLSSDGTSYLIDVAHWGQTTDLREDLAGNQNVDFFCVYAFGRGSKLLRDAARYGKFKQSGIGSNGNTMPDLLTEWDGDNDGIPDNYFEAESGNELESAITQVFTIATASVASGTSASLPPTTGEGEGAVYQAIFFQPTPVAPLAPAWAGQIHALLVDSKGQMREDTSRNGKLDVSGNDFDKIVKFIKTDNAELIYRFDESGNSTLVNTINDLNLLWSSTDWLNNLSDAAITSNRNYENSNSRFIFTFADTNNNMINDGGEVIPFVHTGTSCKDSSNFCSYLTLYENTPGSVAPNIGLSETDLSTLAQRQINFIRGVDPAEETIGGILDSTRNRNFNNKTWRLGDIIYSSPTVVGTPTENYHVIYKDKTYEGFKKKYDNRRQMVYAGANDGMIHAFNAGFYNSTQNAFLTSPNGEHDWPLGMEAWAYVPFNLLPHLKWLMHPDYGPNLHVAYMDLKPRVFDARVFFTNTTTQVSQDSDIYPDGWGTILVAGMRLGGAEIEVDTNKDGTADRSLSSAYVIMDITNPESPPRLIAEITLPGQGFTTCYPTVMPMTQRNTIDASENQWYIVFGSGPADSVGKATKDILGTETSSQPGRLFVLDLKALIADKTLRTVNGTGTLSSTLGPYGLTESNSFISDPIAVDLNIGPYPSSKEFMTDLVYFGTTAGTQNSTSGKMYRLYTNYNSTNWNAISTLIDVAKPITSAASVAKDDNNRLWVYFGTGRLFNTQDIPQNAKMTFYGIKEQYDNTSTVNPANLFDSTNVTLSNSQCSGTENYDCVRASKGGTLILGPHPTPGHWDNLLAAVNSTDGWKIDLMHDQERVLGQPAVLGGTVIFTSNTPTSDVCEAFDANSTLWSVYYKTGTAFYKPILGTSNDILNSRS
jgi:type IV pilus assembly protein PilY1